MTDRRASGQHMSDGAQNASVASVTRSVKTGDTGEGQPATGQQCWPSPGLSLVESDTPSLPIGQNTSAQGHLNRKINDPKCLDGHLLKMGNIIICEKGLKCSGPDKGDYHYPD